VFLLLFSWLLHNAHMLAFDTLPRQLYLHSLLRFPSLYFSRVARILEDAAVSRPEIQRIIDACEGVETQDVQGRTRTVRLPFPEEWVPPNVSPALARFKRSWEGFVDSLVREWKTLNVVSALVCYSNGIYIHDLDKRRPSVVPPVPVTKSQSSPKK
jgi:hypothetical protein